MKSLNHRLLMLVVSVVAGSSLAACEAKKANAPRVPLMVPQEHSLRTYPREDVSFQDVQILMWKEDTDEYSVSRVLEAAGKHDDLQDELYVMNKRLSELSALKALLEADGISLLVPLNSQLIQYEERQAEIARDRKSLEELSLQPQSEERDQAIKDLEKSISKKESKVRKLAGFLTHVREQSLEAELDAWKDLDVRMPVAIEQDAFYVGEIEKDAWRNQSKHIHFLFSFDRDRSIHARIENWDLTQAQVGDPLLSEEAAPTEYSSEARTIGNVTFEPRGGVFTFEVYTPAATYWFKISGNKYNTQDGRIHYKGDIVRCGVSNGFGRPVIVHERDYVKCGVDGAGEPILRRGVVNLADKKNGA